MVNCSIIGCKSRSKRNQPNITFHRFPRERFNKTKWIESTGRVNWQPSSHARICSRHFVSNCFKPSKNDTYMYLRPHSVPTLFIQLVSCLDAVMNKDSTQECRACLRQIDEGSIKLFGPWRKSWAVPGAQIADDLAKISDIEIKKNDKHSKVICLECYSRLSDTCLFIITVQKSDGILRQRLLNETSTNDDAESNSSWPKPILLNKSINSEMENTMEIEIKQEVLSEDENASNDRDLDFEPTMDIKIEPEEIVAPLQSEIILNGYSLKDVNEEDEHQNRQSNDFDGESLGNTVKEEPLSGEDEQETVPDLPLDCMLCMKAFKSVTGLKAHVIAQHSYGTVKRKSQDSSLLVEREQNEFSCASCRRSFKTRTDLMVHEACHGKHVCFVCDAKFNSFRQLSRHGARCRHKRNPKQQSGEPVKKHPRNDEPVIIKAVETKHKVTGMQIELVEKESNKVSKEETKVDFVHKQEANNEHDNEPFKDEVKVEALRRSLSPLFSNEDENHSSAMKESISEPSNNEKVELNEENISDSNQVELVHKEDTNKLSNNDTEDELTELKSENTPSNDVENGMEGMEDFSIENSTAEQSLEQPCSTSQNGADIEEKLAILAVDTTSSNSLQNVNINQNNHDEILHFDVEMAEPERNSSPSLVLESIGNSKTLDDDVEKSTINTPCINEEVPTEIDLLNTQNTENESTHIEQSLESPNSDKYKKASNQQDVISDPDAVKEMKIHLAINPLSEDDSPLLETKMDIEDLENMKSDGCEQKLINVLNELSDDNVTQ